MDKLLKSISYIFHPLFMPIAGVIFYFSKSPRYFQYNVVKGKLIALFILTILLPILIYFILKILNKVNTIKLETARERVYPLIANGVIILMILKHILSPSQDLELYFFFLGILISTMVCIVLAIVNFKASIHMLAISGLCMFFIALSIHYSININATIALMFLLIGVIATSRLHEKAHNYIELIIGLFIGFIPQLILINYWL